VPAGLLIIGSGPAGVSAAEAFRDRKPDAPVRILTADPDLPYARPPLSKEFLRGQDDDIALHPPQWYDDRSIEVTHGVTVEAIDVAQKFVTAGDRRFGYDTLVLACGAAPVPLPVPGSELALQLRSASDAVTLRAAANRAETAVVIGAGFIGCEASASLASQGVSVSLVAPDPAPQVKRLGLEAGRRLRQLVERSGARYLAEARVQALEKDAGRTVVVLDDGARLVADLVLAATGVAPQSGPADSAGLQVRDSRIVVGSDMRTSAPDVFAAGDVALAFNDTAGRHLAVEHWQDAVDQGSIAGVVAAGGTARWSSVPGFWSTIGEATIKYHAWGDGFGEAKLVEHGGGFTVWYSDDAGAAVGVLTYHADDDYEAGGHLIEQATEPPR
jgi:NADPH-dependent 2,4-dienoyl-CoA reductase/sulfur reductase-like enzyme